MAKVTMATLLAEFEELRAAIASAPKTTASSGYRTAAQIAAGDGFACAASPACSRRDLRTAKRAAIHGVDKGGHTAR